ncbi:prepilin peptidase [Tessaracoccus flavus]|nr:prepilin peptidase [Tessaracoccus flavus]
MMWEPAVGAALLAVAVLAWVVPRVRVADPEAPDFASLSTPWSWIAIAATTLLAGLVAGVEPLHWMLWLPYLGLGAPLVYVDLRTTWLPKRLHWLAAAGMAAGWIAVALTDWRTAVAAAAGAAAAGLFLYTAWRVTAALGFGDVRLAFLVGAVAGLGGASGWAASLLAGTVLGAVHGIAHALWARRDRARPAHFPYGPALWLGPIVAQAIAG